MYFRLFLEVGGIGRAGHEKKCCSSGRGGGQSAHRRTTSGRSMARSTHVGVEANPPRRRKAGPARR